MQVLTDALAASRKASAADFKGARGCARAYVSLSNKDYSKLDRKQVAAVKFWAKGCGVIFQTKAHYGLSNAIYIGYDNATGLECAKAEAFAAFVNANSDTLKAYADFGAD